MSQHLVQRPEAGIVAAISHDEEDLPFAAGVVEIALGHVYGVPQRSTANGVDAGNPRFEYMYIARERHVDTRHVGKVEHEHLVLRIGRAREGQCCGFHLTTHLAHASAVVNQQAERDGRIIAREHGDSLPFAVFIDRERRPIEVRD